MSSSVRKILGSKPASLITIDPDATLESAMKLMVESRIGALPVVEGGQLIGIVTERDFVRRVVYKAIDLQTPVRAVMTSTLKTVQSSDSAQHCMETMAGMHIRHLPVVDGGRLTGVLSISDVMRATMEDQRTMIEQLESYIRA